MSLLLLFLGNPGPQVAGEPIRMVFGADQRRLRFAAEPRRLTFPAFPRRLVFTR